MNLIKTPNSKNKSHQNWLNEVIEEINMTPNLPEQLLKASDVAEILNVSRAMAYKLMKTGEIPTIQIGKSKRVRMQDLASYIKDNLVSVN